jgi:hydroxyacylglutathione hydrolase
MPGTKSPIWPEAWPLAISPKVGATVELEALDTPGHDESRVLLSHTDQPALFCGDTPFNAGAGIANGGHPAELWQDVFEQSLPPASTLIYPGHDYIENNLRFTLNREPDNKDAKAMLDKLAGQIPIAPVPRSKTKGGSTRSFDDHGDHEIARAPDLPEKPTSERCSSRPRAAQQLVISASLTS